MRDIQEVLIDSANNEEFIRHGATKNRTYSLANKKENHST